MLRLCSHFPFSRRVGVLLAAGALCSSLCACGSMRLPSLSMPSLSLPFMHRHAPDTTPARQSAENLVRLDAITRSGCTAVNNIDRPGGPGGPKERWIAHTCNGDIVYDVVTHEDNGRPVVEVHAVPGPIDRPMNPDARLVLPDQ
jgi:hypothetical protein